ncbi:GNAT family N-acetyltransferase [Methylocapsa palsarum]|uniref:GNAT family N-acetyltransferase n=1 Tax=Methylocapsa palsarum TaxID=1612308 RepID=UPI001FCCF0A5|nr:GNAT family N-acetyltransferase [Methylocapsa palsarum]
MAAIEAVFAWNPVLKWLRLKCDSASELRHALAAGAAIPDGDDLIVAPEMFWQLPTPWIPRNTSTAFPQYHVMTDGKHHPLRRRQPAGVVYARYIPWLDQSVSFRVLDVDADLERYNRWMNDPRIDAIWDEAGDLGRHRAYLEARLADPHVLPLIGCFDESPFGYFEIYWAKENRLGPYYPSEDYDRGWHVAVGEDAFRGRAWITAWLPSLMHFMLLDDPRTQRIVGEPSATHSQQIRNLEKAGFAKIKHFDFPHKRALLVMLLRERFFRDRLLIPNLTASGQEESLAHAPKRELQPVDERATAQ